jgi:AcrR family transcriptional regulator
MPANQTRVGLDSIIQNAETLFVEHGYQAVSIREIARACGVTNAALYYHFESKLDLYQEVIRRYAAKLTQALERAAADGQDPQEKLKLMAVEYLKLVSEDQSLIHLLRRKPKDIEHGQDSQEFILLLSEIHKPFDEIINQANQDGLLIDLPREFLGTPILMGMLHGLGGYQKVTRNETLTREQIAQVVDLFWRSISRRNID